MMASTTVTFGLGADPRWLSTPAPQVAIDREWPAPKDPALTEKAKDLQKSAHHLLSSLRADGDDIDGLVTIIDQPAIPGDPDPLTAEWSTYGYKFMTKCGLQFGAYVEDFKSEATKRLVRRV